MKNNLPLCNIDVNSGLLYYLMDKHQWIFAIWLIPISLCYDIFWWFQVRWNFWMCKSNVNRLHCEKVIISSCLTKSKAALEYMFLVARNRLL